jgi:hypothetical protein
MIRQRAGLRERAVGWQGTHGGWLGCRRSGGD